MAAASPKRAALMRGEPRAAPPSAAARVAVEHERPRGSAVEVAAGCCRWCGEDARVDPIGHLDVCVVYAGFAGFAQGSNIRCEDFPSDVKHRVLAEESTRKLEERVQREAAEELF